MHFQSASSHYARLSMFVLVSVIISHNYSRSPNKNVIKCFFKFSCFYFWVLPGYNRTSWLGVKHQLTYLLIFECPLTAFPVLIFEYLLTAFPVLIFECLLTAFPVLIFECLLTTFRCSCHTLSSSVAGTVVLSTGHPRRKCVTLKSAVMTRARTPTSLLPKMTRGRRKRICPKMLGRTKRQARSSPTIWKMTGWMKKAAAALSRPSLSWRATQQTFTISLPGS